MIDPTLTSELAESVRTIARIPAEVAIESESLLVEDLGIDSLDLVSIVLSTQETYGIAIDEDEVANFQTLRNLVDYVATRRSATAA